MVVLNYTGGEVNAKIVYYGPGLSGKTTNLEFIHERTPEGSRGKMVSMKTQTDRTLFFDFLPLELGDISGYRTRFLLYTVPGQVYYNATRKLVLKGADAVVFVADSSRGKLDENLESLRNLEQNLNEHGMSLDEIPWVIQYNKRDVADAMAVPDLDARLNPLRVPSYEAVATSGKGVYDTFHGIATLVYRVLKERLEREDLVSDDAPMPEVPVMPGAAAPAPDSPAGPARAEGEVEFDSAIDSMLREMDGPAAKQQSAPKARPDASASPRSHPAPVRAEAEIDPAPAVPAKKSSAPAAGGHETSPSYVKSAKDSSDEDTGRFEAIPEAFDEELGRLPSLDDASFASDSARDEGPNEFVTDPMRRSSARPAKKPKAKPAPSVDIDAAANVAVELEPAEAPEPAPEPAPAPKRAPETVDTPLPTTVTVPVTLSRRQLRPGSMLRVVLEVTVKDE